LQIIGENRICDMCITEDENKGLKELYESVLESKQTQLLAMKNKIESYENKAKEKQRELEQEQNNYNNTIENLENKKVDSYIFCFIKVYILIN
jgi:thiamine pyrophosphate-dependent acetolactate synthase large subunit-like protein